MIKNAVLLAALICLLPACTPADQATDGGDRTGSYYQISQEEAAEWMTRDDGHVIVDVRGQDEFDTGHIPGAICIPNESIGTEPPEGLPDLDQIILVYCRSGRRSKEAAQKLANMGYSRVYEFGGIIDWTGELVTDDPPPVEALRPVPVLVIEANGHTFYASLEENSSAQALAQRLSDGAVEIVLHDYGSFEKVGDLPWALPRNDTTITTQPGDVILYQGDQITLYYDENTWNFTQLARIDDVTRQDLLDVFGDGDVTVTFRVEWSE